MKHLKLIPLAILHYSGIALLFEKLISRNDAFLILCYHKIGHIENCDARYCVSQELFEDQIKFITKYYDIVRFSDIDRAGNSTKKKILITFDDGSEDNYINAFSIIKKYNIPVYIFLISAFINSKYFLNWYQIVEMKKSGLIHFCNHTRDHTSIKTLSYNEIKSQILDSDKELRNNLNSINSNEYFSYPYGDFGSQAIGILKGEGFKYGLTVIEGINDRSSNPFLLKRISIYNLDTKTRFLLNYPNLYYTVKSWFHKILTLNLLSLQ